MFICLYLYISILFCSNLDLFCFPQVFSLRWNQHQTNMLSVFDKLLQSEV